MKELLAYISDPKNPRYNFTLGRWYETQGHTAAAASYYIRTAEYSSDVLLQYEALLRMAICFTKQGSRTFVVKGLFLRAISLLPDRPEAYFLISQCYEVNKDWQEAYTFATLGETVLLKNNYKDSLKTDVGYPGSYGFIFEKAVTGWWMGLMDESLYLFKQLSLRTDLSPEHVIAVKNNINNLGGVIFKEPSIYYNSMYEYLKFKFPGAKDIEQSFSQCYQDMFVLTALNGKRDGKFLEIGCGDPFYGNNTALLEKFGWDGISIDIDKSATDKFVNNRKSRTITTDATKLDYTTILEGDYDYLQIDCDPALNSLEILLRIPFETHRFSVITFEHDDYCSEGIKERSRSYLESLGYVLVVNDVAFDKYNSFEDWWVHPDEIRHGIIYKLQEAAGTINKGSDYMLIKL